MLYKGLAMAWWGKLIGGFCGYLLGGPFGLVLGVIVGHFFDQGVQRQRQFWHFGANRSAPAQAAFFKATFLVMGHISKADGRVSEAEIQAARNVMASMGLSDELKQQAIDLFNQGKQADFDLEHTLSELNQACHHNKVLLRLFVELQARVASADGGVISQAKQKVLQIIYQRLGFAPFDSAFFGDFFNFQQQYQQHQQQGYQQGGQYRPPGRRHELPLKDAYILLGVTESASDAEVKRAYRRLMSQHHPDKLVSKGLPEGMIKLATEKTQNIKAAYDRICAARGV